MVGLEGEIWSYLSCRRGLELLGSQGRLVSPLLDPARGAAEPGPDVAGAEIRRRLGGGGGGVLGVPAPPGGGWWLVVWVVWPGLVVSGVRAWGIFLDDGMLLNWV